MIRGVMLPCHPRSASSSTRQVRSLAGTCWCLGWRWHPPLEGARNHCQRAVQCVAEVICQVGVKPGEEEVLGPTNKWFCAQAYGRKIEDEAELWKHFIQKRGAADFARRWKEAMSELNRYYCYLAHGGEIHDEVILWRHYTAHCDNGPGGSRGDHACSR